MSAKAHFKIRGLKLTHNALYVLWMTPEMVQVLSVLRGCRALSGHGEEGAEHNDQLWSAAPCCARRAAPRADARWRDGGARRPPHRSAAPRHRETHREQNLHAGEMLCSYCTKICVMFAFLITGYTYITIYYLPEFYFDDLQSIDV